MTSERSGGISREGRDTKVSEDWEGKEGALNGINRETWKTSWIFQEDGSRRRYETSPICSTISKGPKRLSSSFREGDFVSKPLPSSRTNEPGRRGGEAWCRLS